MKGTDKLSLLEAMPIIQLVVFFNISSLSRIQCIAIWFLVHAICSYYLVLTSLIGTHHHTSVYHAGDYPRKETDWGLRQMDTTNDVDKRAMGGFLFSAASFGDHLIHHFFPTVDHSKLHLLYPALEETCKEFAVRTPKFGNVSVFAKEMHLQLARSRPNTFEDRNKRKP